VIRDEDYHLYALRTNGRILEGLRRLWQPKAAWIDPEKVIRILNAASVGFVVIGAYGVTGYRDEPQATGDMDVLIRRRHHRRAATATAEAFPKLVIHKGSSATRFEDPVAGRIVIDLWKPIEPLLRVMWKHAVLIKALYHIPVLEMVLACKLTMMLSSSRDYALKYLDRADFMNVARTNGKDINLKRFRELAEVAAPGGGRKYVRCLHDARADRWSRW
jgi:hypothetical protein